MREPSEDHANLVKVMLGDPLRRAALLAVATCGIPTAAIAAGFVRDAIWDDQHGYGIRPPLGDVDVVFHDPTQTDPARDRSIEQQLRDRIPQLDWSVKNQARMHDRNGDQPYADVGHAMSHWPETATAVAVTRVREGDLRIVAPFGLADLFGLILRPTPAFVTERRAIFHERIAAKRWLERYPRLRLAA